MKNILITGAGGFLGKYLVDALIKKTDHIVYAFDVSKDILADRFPQNKRILFFDTEDWEKDRIPFENVYSVVHCAFIRTNTGSDLTKSLIFSQKLFIQSINNNCHLINISSRSVYGQNENIPWNENTSPEPDTLYALAKLSSEIIIQSVFNSVRNIHFTNIRLAGLVGKELKDRITNKFINNAINGKPLNITGGKQQFSYLDVHDAADGIIALLKTPPEVWKTVYNLGYLKSYGILEIAELVTQVAKKFNCPEVKINLNKADGSLHAEIDSTLFYNDTNWKPMYDMKATIDSIFRYELEHKIKELEL